MLVVSGLTAAYGGRPVARLAGLTLAPGQAALILGPSGSGKTSLLLAMAGLVDIHAGGVRIGDTDIGALSLAQRDRYRGRNIGLVFQDIHLIPGLSTLDNLLLAPYAAGLPQDVRRALALLEQLGLGDKAARPAQTLSRGQAQRAAIARAMLMQPKLILADEPTASLDDDACRVVGDLLTSAAAETGAMLLIATHDHRLKARIPTVVAAEPVAAGEAA
ncbi:MAG: ABC-type transport system ATPase component [Caulobacteraceae bacterium]|nr:ABC-type transport system ATPase component [Caulobacteraceae bacterium]